MRITLVQPAIGHRIGESYIRSWQMEPLPIAALAGLTPSGVDLRFHDDRLETIPFDEPTDAVAIPVETYTARRAYQIANHYRQRGIPVVLGGFHPTLVPDEAARFSDSIVIGEAEAVWSEVVDDLAHRTLKSLYHGERTNLSGISVDRSIFQGKRYLPIGLVETGRGCRFPCEFCAIQTFFQRSYRARPADDVAYVQYGGYEPLTVKLTTILAEKSGIGWSTYSHTGGIQQTSAIGVGAELFGSYYDQTDIYKKMMTAAGFEIKTAQAE